MEQGQKDIDKSSNSDDKGINNHSLPNEEELYKKVFDYANDAIFIMDFEKFVNCNNKAVEIFGCNDKKDLLCHNPFDFSPKLQPDGISSKEKALKYINYAAKGMPQRFYWVHKKKDGENFECEVTLNKITEDNPNLILGIVRDISFQKKLENQLIKLSIATEQSPVSIVITDTNGDIEYVNPKFTEITGYTVEELIGKNPRVLKSGWTSNEEYKKLWETITSGKMWKGIFKNKRKDGSFYWESALIAPIKNSSGRITNFIGIKEDITRQKELEEQLFQMQKLESIGTLTSGIAHDFNNILTAINGYAQLILAKMDSHDELYEYVQNILIGGERAAELVRNLLAFSRKQIIQPKIININETIGEVEKILKNTIDEDIDVYLQLDKDLMAVKADPSQFQQLFINLITNARDAVNQKASSNKKIIVKTENISINANEDTRYPGVKNGDYVCITIEDNGIGMDDATLKKIYDPFFTTKPKWQGTGLGLSTVYGIVKQNNGYIYATSSPGEGTTFKIFWPVDKTVKEKIEVLENQWKPSFKGKGGTVVVVEDDETLREFIIHSLHVSGYKVISAENGLSALKKIENGNTEQSIDLIVSDIVMPNMGGIELIKRLREKYPKVKAILITGYPIDQDKKLNSLEKDIYLLKKPFKHSDLINLVKKLS